MSSRTVPGANSNSLASSSSSLPSNPKSSNVSATLPATSNSSTPPPPSSVAAASAAFSSHLTNSALPLIALRDFYRQSLSYLLRKVGHPQSSNSSSLPLPPLPKALIIDRSISGPLGLVAEVDLLTKSGIEKIFYLQPGELSTPIQHLVYLVRPNVNAVRIIAAHIHQHQLQMAINANNSTNPKTPGGAVPLNPVNIPHTYTIILVPRKTIVIEKEFEKEGVLGEISEINEFPLELIPFETDILSMEQSLSFKELYIDGDTTSLIYISKSLFRIQNLWGSIPVIKGKGVNALKVVQLLQRMKFDHREKDKDRDIMIHNNIYGGVDINSPTQSGAGPGSTGEIAELLIFDRTVDFLSPFLTQSTYEGLIDEIFSIKNSYIEVEAELIGAKGDGLKKLSLNSNDTLFKETRDLPFRLLGPLLHKKAEFIRETYEDRHALATVNEMAEFMTKFKSAHAEHSLLQTHINLAEKIAGKIKSKVVDRRMEIEKMIIEGGDTDAIEDYIETSIGKQSPLVMVLRLIALYIFATPKGLSMKKYESWKLNIIQTYGFETLFTLQNLEKIGLFVGGRKRTFQSIKKQWKIYNEQFSLNTAQTPGGNTFPSEINYVYNGFAPLIPKLVELSPRGGWRNHLDTLNLLPGPQFEFNVGGDGEKGTGATAAGSIGAGWDPSSSLINLLEMKSGTSGVSSVSSPRGIPSSTSLPPTTASATGGKKPIIFVFFIGGVTFSEISALRCLSENPSHGYEYIVGTTKLINGNTLMESLQEAVQNRLKGNPSGKK